MLGTGFPMNPTPTDGGGSWVWVLIAVAVVLGSLALTWLFGLWGRTTPAMKEQPQVHSGEKKIAA